MSHEEAERAAALACLGIAVRQGDPEIYSGVAAGVAHASLCAVLAAQLKLVVRLPLGRIGGSGENVERVLADPRQLGYAPLDACSRSAGSSGRRAPSRSCARTISLAASAGRQRFMLPRRAPPAR